MEIQLHEINSCAFCYSLVQRRSILQDEKPADVTRGAAGQEETAGVDHEEGSKQKTVHQKPG